MSETGFLPVPDMSAPQRDDAPYEQAAPFPDASLEQAYQFDRQMLHSPAPAASKGLLLLGTLALFILTETRGSDTIFNVAALIGVLLFHESGHLVGMKLFGYRDVKMFFIPFFGAAVSGRKGSVAGWKVAVVLLLGPLPGLLAGTILSFYLRIHPSPLWRSLAVSLVMINAFNLLPIVPLDGGQFFRTLIFSRHRYLEVAFGALAGILLLAGGAALRTVILPLIGLGTLIGLPRQARLLRVAKELKDQYGTLPAEPTELRDAQARDLFLGARKVTLNAPRRRPRDGAAAMEQLLERAVAQTPSLLASVALLVPWGIGIIAGLIGAVLLAMTSAPDWQVQKVSQGGFSVRMPHRSPVTLIQRETPLGNTAVSSLDATGTSGMFDVRWYALPAGARPQDESKTSEFLDRSRDLLIARAEGKLLEEGPLPDGRSGRAFRMSSEKYGTTVGRIVLVESRVFILLAPAEPAEETKLFFDSFTRLSDESKSSAAVPP